MLSAEENELVTRTGPGTALGQLMRRYWIPALLSEELPEPDCAPVRVRLLGELLVAFRDTHGRVGLIDEFCAHRRASLFLGRNEEAGLRCVYHGWKYDLHGNCTDMPNEPPENRFQEKIRLKAYQTIELGNVIWAFMGPSEKVPPLPKFEWTQVPETHRHVSKTWQEACNWLQALEGGIDSIHAAFLHRNLTNETSRAGHGPGGYVVAAAAAKIDVQLTDYGLVYAVIGPPSDGKNYVRTVHYVMPFHQVRAYPMQKDGKTRRIVMRGHMWVPMDDYNCMVYHWISSADGQPLSPEEIKELEKGSGRGPGEQTSDYKPVRNRQNNWMIDRLVQRTETFTGIEGTNTQDEAVQASMGPIVDRTQEHLGQSDKAIIAARRMLLGSIRTVQDGGNPPGLTTSFYSIRGAGAPVPESMNWRDSLKDDMRLPD
jgi:phenylpropionate dioxygenase-like ring-hydroxylating dioxygenase large terminal subunit